MSAWNGVYEPGEELSREEFCNRFVARMIEKAGSDLVEEDGRTVTQYAEETAPTYYDDPALREEGPEECADADMSYWGEE